MEKVVKIAAPVALLSGVLLVGYVSMKVVTPTQADIERVS